MICSFLRRDYPRRDCFNLVSNRMTYQQKSVTDFFYFKPDIHYILHVIEVQTKPKYLASMSK